jgi:hypothetical protein
MTHIDAEDVKLDEMSDETLDDALSNAEIDSHGWAGPWGATTE